MIVETKKLWDGHDLVFQNRLNNITTRKIEDEVTKRNCQQFTMQLRTISTEHCFMDSAARSGCSASNHVTEASII